MKRNNNKIIRSAVIAGAITMGAGSHSGAVPVNGMYVEDSRCDIIPQQLLTHELGDAAVFPINEAFVYTLVSTPFQTVCVPDDGVANDWDVVMTNVSGIAWRDLFFVGDMGTKVGNADGSVADLNLAPAILTDAFRIDGTVTLGINNNLVGESGPIDEVFDPGETWRFSVSNFIDAFGGATPPTFLTPGVFAGSSPPIPGQLSNASILANPVPEPSLISAIGIVAGALLMRRPKRN